ncbi:hypothetical protein WBP_0649 [Wolbachia endosymbiont of Brugia pahangi]|nr:hypothetical protein WBP_0649 [Wolbachia endosymbiont of Brugia pahangi]
MNGYKKNGDVPARFLKALGAPFTSMNQPFLVQPKEVDVRNVRAFILAHENIVPQVF